MSLAFHAGKQFELPANQIVALATFPSQRLDYPQGEPTHVQVHPLEWSEKKTNLRIDMAKNLPDQPAP
jgi:hypothetical protein